MRSALNKGCINKQDKVANFTSDFSSYKKYYVVIFKKSQLSSLNCYKKILGSKNGRPVYEITGLRTVDRSTHL